MEEIQLFRGRIQCKTWKRLWIQPGTVEWYPMYPNNPLEWDRFEPYLQYEELFRWNIVTHYLPNQLPTRRHRVTPELRHRIVFSR